MRLFLVMLTSYLIGSIPVGYIITMFTKKVDVRDYGSGNVGATNVMRVVGKSAALLTLILDVVKGFIVVTFWADMVYSYRMNLSYQELVVLLGLCAVIGHITSLFLDFKGGKGVATSAGVLLGICPKLLFVGLCVWLLVFVLGKIVSLASVAAAITIPIASYFFDYPDIIRYFLIFLGVLIFVKHKDNLERIVRKEEKRWSVKI